MQRLPLALALIVLFGAKIVIHTGNPEYLLTTVLLHFSCMGAPLMALYSLQYSILTFCVASDAPVFNTSIGRRSDSLMVRGGRPTLSAAFIFL